MPEPVMEICSRCKGRGEREVELTNGQKELKKCWMCDGEGKIPVFKSAPKPPVEKTIPAPKKVQRPLTHLNAPMGDLSWIPGRKANP